MSDFLDAFNIAPIHAGKSNRFTQLYFPKPLSSAAAHTHLLSASPPLCLAIG